MKKFVTAIIIILLNVICVKAQKPQVAIFVYSDNNTPTTALRSQLTSSFLEGGNSEYGVVDRTDEILNQLKQEYQYVGSGLVNDDQLISVGEHLESNYICVVAITFYADYKQYFFDGKLIDVNTRQVIKNALYPKEGEAVVNSMDPQTQMRVGKELAKQLELFSPEQLAAERRKERMKEEARKQAEKETRGFRVGDIWEGNTGRETGFRVGYLDGTGKHGLAYKVCGLSYNPAHDSRPIYNYYAPSRSQLYLLYNNRRVLGLNGEYWSGERTGKSRGYDDFFYTIDFASGKTHERRQRNHEYTAIWVVEF